MGWTHIPEVDSTASKSEDNPFAGPKSQPTGKVSISMPTDEWLCSKMGKLNVTLTEGYPSRSSEAGGLLKDQFVRPPKSQWKWYHFVSSQKNPDQQTGKIVTTWSTDASKINSTYSCIAKAAGIASTPPASRQISQDNLRQWEKSAHEASTFCNQAAAFNRCLYKVQDSLSPAYPNAVENVPRPWLASEFGKIRTGAKTGFQLCRLPVRSQVRSGPTHTGPVAKPTRKVTVTACATGLSGPAVYVPDRIANRHRETRPIQWHLKNNWRVPELLEKVIPIPRTLHPHLHWWLDESNVLQGQPLHPIKHALQIFTDASKEGWGAHLNEHTARGSWSLSESKLHINYLELKAVLLALKDYRDLCSHKIVLVATDNTTVVSYINKEGGMRSGPLCALLWRILTWCTRHQVTLKARHIPGRLNVVADKLSTLGQVIQTKWSLLPEVFQAVCNRWHRPQIDLFATRFNNKLPQFVSPVPDSLATAVDALSLPWEDLDAYAFPPVALLGKVVEKLQNSPCIRIILIAPGWPNMPWFWDLVAMSSQIPLSLSNLPNLLTQPFNQIPQLTKAPFEPIKEASLKHLTFKIVFLLALGSGKRRSEIHAWQNKNIRHQSDWSKVSLYPSPSFLSKNQLAKEGPDSVAPVIIPALAPTLYRSLKSDRSLCPIRALRYYLDRTSDIRQNKELVFVSFKKGFNKDISPATISSWIKQTVILCYELSDQEAHTLHQVKAHDVRAFAASKAF